MRTHKIFNDITFIKVKDCLYNANYNVTELTKFIQELIESFTYFKLGKTSFLSDIPITEEILSRIITDKFLIENESIVKEALTGVIINCNLGDINYKITIAYNQEQLGGIVYGILT